MPVYSNNKHAATPTATAATAAPSATAPAAPAPAAPTAAAPAEAPAAVAATATATATTTTATTTTTTTATTNNSTAAYRAEAEAVVTISTLRRFTPRSYSSSCRGNSTHQPYYDQEAVRKHGNPLQNKGTQNQHAFLDSHFQKPNITY